MGRGGLRGACVDLEILASRRERSFGRHALTPFCSRYWIGRVQLSRNGLPDPAGRFGMAVEVFFSGGLCR